MNVQFFFKLKFENVHIFFNQVYDSNVSIPELLSRLRSCLNSHTLTAATIVECIRQALNVKGNISDSVQKSDSTDLEFQPRPRVSQSCDVSKSRLFVSRKIRRRAMPGPRSKAYQALRAKSQLALKEWEKELNRLVAPREAKIFVENSVDLEGKEGARNLKCVVLYLKAPYMGEIMVLGDEHFDRIQVGWEQGYRDR